MNGDWFVKILLLQYILATIAYASQGTWWKACYWFGAIWISVAALKLK